jgi:Protein of unknown function (DUF3141)
MRGPSIRLELATKETGSERSPASSPSRLVGGESDRPCRRSLAGEPVNAPATPLPLQAFPTADALFGIVSKILGDFAGYQRDAWERSILFLDVLRQRADNILAHERAGKPPLLNFDYETVLDARSFDRPANYALLRITRYADKCLDDCLDPGKPPVIIVDPRAGHGPGIGGFKRESEVGVALHEGHPVYFVAFFPEPCPGQALGDVLHALRRFIDEVSALHGGKPPILYGNCQAGWAIALLAADCHGLVGPAVLNGSPLSYWAGESGVNPARVSGGLLGGAWTAHLAADLGNGRFDGAWLVQGFENLRPEAVWGKYAHLFAEIRVEDQHFLDFERWWNGFYFFSREEILAVIENLFIGDRLEQGTVRICEGCFADLRRIRNPLVIFASYGDNITPPHQALGWIPRVYRNTDDLKQAGQRIVYLTNPHVGHLGIFVSAAVARFEHRAILDSLTKIEALPYGLYEMKIDHPTGDPDCRHDAYSVRFEERRVEDLKFPVDTIAFERARNVSAQLDAVYSAALGPFIRALSSPLSASGLEWLHPMRTSRYAFSSALNPLFAGVIASLASFIRLNPHPAADDNPFKSQELATIKAISDLVYCARRLRDGGCEQLFSALYGEDNPLARLIQSTPEDVSLKDDHQRAPACSTGKHHNLAA